MKRTMIVTGIVGGGASAPATYTISGVVYDADGTTAVAGATVALGELTATSAANGSYTITGVEAGIVTAGMTCTKSGYSFPSIPITEPVSGNLTAQNFTNNWYASGGISANVIAAYRAIGAVNKAASINSLVGTNHLAEQGTVTWDGDNGWSGFSEANYLNGSYNWSTSYSYALRFSGISSVGYKRAIHLSDDEYMYIIPYGDDGNAYIINNNKLWSAPRASSGVIVVTPTKCYVNGVAATDLGPNGGTYTGTTWQVGKGFGSNVFSGNEQALEIINEDLTEAKILILTDAMEALANPS